MKRLLIAGLILMAATAQAGRWWVVDLKAPVEGFAGVRRVDIRQDRVIKFRTGTVLPVDVKKLPATWTWPQVFSHVATNEFEEVYDVYVPVAEEHLVWDTDTVRASDEDERAAIDAAIAAEAAAVESAFRDYANWTRKERFQATVWYELDKRLRVLESKPAITKAQFLNGLNALWDEVP